MIYCIEDDQNIRQLAMYALKNAGLPAQGFSCYSEFQLACKQQLPDLVILDIMLPDVDGLEILNILRKDKQLKDVLIMMMTAKGSEYDTVVALDAGADDYLSKPFGLMEFVSRVNSLLRRSSRSSDVTNDSDILKFDDIAMNLRSHEVYAGDVLVNLTFKEYCLLKILLENKSRVLSREYLLREVWDITYAGASRTVDAHIQTRL